MNQQKYQQYWARSCRTYSFEVLVNWDNCKHNVCLFYRKNKTPIDNSKEYSLKCLRICIAECLRTKDTINNKRAISEENKVIRKIKNSPLLRPSDDTPHDKLNHFPMYETKSRCYHCQSEETHWSCSKCSVRLCFVKKRNCFIIFNEQ